ncbi:MAG: hypothetical protein EOP54_17670 [Sphingobacteriales bacterium]|nr:MAG: hypothetical protein EOP54_17670 [Sphingobacteriales bacterium]
MAWHPFWGAFAFSLIMGGQPEERLKSLYKSLGFLHVLVISGSQFTLLAAWLRTLMRWPAHILYSSLIVDWKIFRSLALIADFLSLLGLLVYLLACGASPPCQRAFLQQVLMSGRKWCGPPRYKGKGSRAEGVLFRSQMMLFPDAWFSLSNLLSWGAVSALSMFHKTRSFTAQLKTSLGIQLLSLAIFSRLSISALLLDFFLTPFWDVLLVICLAGIFVPELSIQTTLIRVLDYFHDGLWVIEAWQDEVPEGKQTAWAYCHVPNGSTKDMTAIIENQVERFAPGFKDTILAKHTYNTAQLQEHNPNYIGGDINGGIIDIGQLFTRPVLRWSPYKTSAKGLYICSSSTPPGGGVHGMCGWYAAKRALKDVFAIDVKRL